VSVTDPRRVAGLYQDTRQRIAALLDDHGDAAWGAPVPACPGWSVGDVVAHLIAVAEDWAAGTLAGAPTDEQTAEHVRRFAGHDRAELLDRWAAAGAELCRRAETDGLIAPVGDVTSHEHDIRGALGRPGDRGSEAVRYSSSQVLTRLNTSVPLRVSVEDADYRCGPDAEPQLCLTSTRFEALRWRTGRRSHAQILAMDWSADPTPVLGELCLFGPTTADLIE
jgi:uncharacterized protein (TIGR03083 family)